MKRIFSRIRFLPLTIFAATLMLTVKVGDIWDGFDGLINGTINIAEAVAQTAEEGAKPAAKDDGQPADGEKTAEGAVPAALKDEPQGQISKLITDDPTLLTQAEIDLLQQLAERRQGNLDGFDGLINGTIQIAEAVAQTAEEGAKPAAKDDGQPADGEKTAEEAVPAALKDEPQGQISKLITDDPTLLTQAEIDLLQQLAERRQVLESREQELEIRTGLLAAAESRIDKKVEELRVLRETISGLIKTFDAQQDAKLLSLVKIYESMKPKEAARIFEELEMDTLLEVAERMKERKLAPIMAKMDPEKARDMTVELSRLRQLPTVGQQAGG